MSENYEGPYAFGINATTGLPLDVKKDDLLALEILDRQQQETEAVSDPVAGLESFGLRFGCDGDNLAEVGWGVIFAAETNCAPYLEALEELLALRSHEAGNRYRIFSGADGYRKNDKASDWLERRGVSLNMIDPDDGVPYYLTIVGPPSEIPFEFQYSLDIVAAVGRLDFASMEEFKAYASSVTRFERETVLMTKRRIDLFATCHEFDRATQLFTKQVAVPLSTGDGRHKEPLGQKYRFAINAFLNDLSTKQTLRDILSTKERPSSILFTGTHGMAFGADDERQLANQGALVCQDWPGYGHISSEHWFSANDVPADANVHGLMHFFFACYGAGTPEYDNFNFSANSPRIAAKSMTARLPQKLMTLPQGGVLASLGHIDRAWASSFQSKKGLAQTQGFTDVLNRLMAGWRVGSATDQFNNQWGVIGTELIEALRDKTHGKAVRENDLLALQTARDDCRNYVVLGDPAVKLRPEPGT